MTVTSPFIEKYKRFLWGKGHVEVDDVTGCLLFLLSDLSKHVTGQDIIVDDGFLFRKKL